MSWTGKLLGAIRKRPVTSSVLAGLAGTQIGDWLDISPGDALANLGDGDGPPELDTPWEDFTGKVRLAIVAGAVGVVGLVVVAGSSLRPRRIG